MIENLKQQQHLSEYFPFLNHPSSEFGKPFFRSASLIHIPAGHTIASEGTECNQLALLVSGQVRVYKLADSGREITLYRISKGDSCVLTASCIMSNTPFPAIATAETDVDAVLVPSRQVHEWMSESKPWNTFIFGLIAKRLTEVIAVLEGVAFHRMDERIAAYLIAIASQGQTLNITHHEIASDLGTSREVVSRILKEFEGKGLIKGARSKLTVVNLAGLQNYRQ
ncbi:MAG: Crp/Fnr family transcriptional regulator [Gammaproteobacteria bacterium]|nr:Crp/Fnr family transcriptional regulator [Gammaproteobacteria bacterium]